MLYREVPKNGDKLSALGFGAMRLPVRMGRLMKKRRPSRFIDAIDSA